MLRSNRGGGSSSQQATPSLSVPVDDMWCDVRWMPHSSLSQTSHVSLAIRSIHTTILPNSIKDHVDDPDMLLSSLPLSSLPSSSSEEWRVNVTVCGMAGLPLSVSSSTTSSPLFPRKKSRKTKPKHTDKNNNIEIVEQRQNNKFMHKPRIKMSTHDCYWNDGDGGEYTTYHQEGYILQLPLRWRDLPRDAYLLLEVYGSSKDNPLFTKSLSLFDEYGKLRTGLQLVELDKQEEQTQGNSEGEVMIIRQKQGIINPGLLPPPRGSNKQPSEWAEDDDVDNYDPIWKASRILDQLERFEHQQTPASTMPNDRNDQSSSDAAAAATATATTDYNAFGQIQSVPWLDSITKDCCEQILRDTAAYVTGDIQENGDTEDDMIQDFVAPHKEWTSSSAHLILELPTFDVPIMHEETFYPIPPLGASGLVSALDLSLYMQQQQQQEESNKDDNDVNDNCLVVVPFLDHENEHDNPVEDKYRTLAHDILRGLVDPALKPDREQRARLASIIASPSHHPTREEKDLLWRFRFSLVDNHRALTKFLLAVDWTVESEVVQAAELLEQWRKRSPIEVTDALKLLGKHVAFQTSLVRAYAIDTLATAPDDELSLYLLQLVQALKYENTTNAADRLASSTSNKNSSPGSSVASGTARSVSSLANFLIDRASKNLELANYLYWYLKVELHDPTHGARYREVFSALQEKLSMSPFRHNASSRLSPKSGSKNEGSKGIMNLVDSVSKAGSSLLSEHSHDSVRKKAFKERTIWEILVSQDKLISGLMDCQMRSRDARGKKDAKESQLRDSLSSEGFGSNVAVPLPSAPEIFVTGVNPQTAKVFKSALYPALIEFRVGSPDNTQQKSSGYRVIVKTGDDLRQDQLVIMMIKLMDGLLKRGTLDLCLTPYSIIATSPSSGLVEFVSDSHPISQILTTYNNSIMQFFRKYAPHPGAKYDVETKVMQNYVRSCAGYCVITYLLGVGDRHLDNIMLQEDGHFFHIDFGFIFGRDPKPLPPAFRLTREMVEGMGGVDSAEYRQFCSLSCQAFNALRKSAGLVLNLLHLMSDASIEDLSNNPSADAEGVISKVEERFRLELTDEQAEKFFVGLINDSLFALAPRVMDVFHSIAVARR